MADNENTNQVYIRVFDDQGNLTDPVRVPKVVRTDEEWAARLSAEQYKIMRRKGTEAAFCGGLLDNKIEGYYLCAGCGLPLFGSGSKFQSGTGWPSFFQPVAAENILEHSDSSYGMRRVEILCRRCESHLGHVFEDGPKPTGLRYCLNSASLEFIPESSAANYAEEVSVTSLKKAVFAGGCFWCVEAVFEEIDGVVDAVSGYAGGNAEDANYEAVCSGRTAHAEVVEVIYDATKVNYEDLLRIHFATHDPTTLNRQGHDTGTQYRSAIFYEDDEQKKVAETFIADLNGSKVFESPIVTSLEPLEKFYEAEEYHQNYACRNPSNPYIRGVALPKVEKLRKILSSPKS